jgi:hypothetical protein
MVIGYFVAKLLSSLPIKTVAIVYRPGLRIIHNAIFGAMAPSDLHPTQSMCFTVPYHGVQGISFLGLIRNYTLRTFLPHLYNEVHSAFIAPMEHSDSCEAEYSLHPHR